MVGDILWLHETNLHEEVRQERVAVRPTEDEPSLGGWRERYAGLAQVDPGLHNAYLSLPYSDGSTRFTEPGYFSNVSRFSKEFDFVTSYLPRRGLLLDLGADGTWSTARLASSGLTCVALDITDHLTLGDLYQTKYPHYARVNVDMHADVFECGSFDVVTAFNAMHHSKRLHLLAHRIASHLRVDGLLAFIEPYVQGEVQGRAFGMPQVDLGINENIHSLSEWHHAFESAGLSLVTYAITDAFCAVYRKDALNSPRCPTVLQDADGFLANYYDVQIEAEPGELTVQSGQPIEIRITIQNHSRGAWVSRGPWPVRLSYHLKQIVDGGEVMVSFDNARTDLDQIVSATDRAVFDLQLNAPASGEYLFEFDLVQESKTWFRDRGGSGAIVRCKVL